MAEYVRIMLGASKKANCDNTIILSIIGAKLSLFLFIYYCLEHLICSFNKTKLVRITDTRLDSLNRLGAGSFIKSPINGGK